MAAAMQLPTLTAKDLTSDQDVRWCPGCGDYSILAQMKKVLAAAGIAPPGERGGPVLVPLAVPCPRCGSRDTRELSRFSGTACKALHQCRVCMP